MLLVHCNERCCRPDARLAAWLLGCGFATRTSKQATWPNVWQIQAMVSCNVLHTFRMAIQDAKLLGFSCEDIQAWSADWHKDLMWQPVTVQASNSENTATPATTSIGPPARHEFVSIDLMPTLPVELGQLVALVELCAMAWEGATEEDKKAIGTGGGLGRNFRTLQLLLCSNLVWILLILHAILDGFNVAASFSRL